MRNHNQSELITHNQRFPLKRRTFLHLASLALASVGLAACDVPPPAAQTTTALTPDVELSLTAKASTVAVLPGAETHVWHYTGEVLKGDATALQMIDDSYLGPILRLHKGQHVRIHFKNNLPEESIIHWHGLILPEKMDGHPRFAVGTGESYLYDFTVQNQAGTYWFHPHPHGRTGAQVYQGLAGLFLVTDDEESALGLPDGEYDIPLVIQDRQFDDQQQFVYGATAGSSGGMMSGMNHGNSSDAGLDMMTGMMGQLGDRILVNGHPDFILGVATRAYRLRLLNGSNSRVYKLGWKDGTPLTVIGGDAGLLERPLKKNYVTLAPGERIELWADFRDEAPGAEHQLLSLAFSGVEAGNMMENSSLPQGAAFPVMTVRIERQEEETRTLPNRLISLDRLDPAQAVNTANPRRFELYMNNMVWTINGRTFAMDEVAAEEKIPLNQIELWEFANLPGRGMMADFMAHPMHIHGVHFQVIDRQIDPAYAEGWASLSDGFVDEGWHDTVLVMPGERVRLLARFTEPGLFVYHCHLLEHEDQSMMRNIRVDG